MARRRVSANKRAKDNCGPARGRVARARRRAVIRLSVSYWPLREVLEGFTHRETLNTSACRSR